MLCIRTALQRPFETLAFTKQRVNLSSANVSHNAPDFGGVSVFKKVDALPCAQRHATFRDWDLHTDLQKSRLDVGRHVVGTLVGVSEVGHCWVGGWRHEPLKESREVLPCPPKLPSF